MVATEVTVLNPAINGAIVGGVAIDTVNGNKFVYSQSTEVTIVNLEATDAFTVIITTATPDAKGFTKTITEAVPAGKSLTVNFLSEEFQSGGYVNIAYTGTGTDGLITIARLQKGNQRTGKPEEN